METDIQKHALRHSRAGRPFSLEEECPPTAHGEAFLDFSVEDTANVMPGDKDRYLAVGMDDFLAKPFNKAGLGAKLACTARR